MSRRQSTRSHVVKAQEGIGHAHGQLPLLGRRERRELLIPTAAAPWVQLLSVDALGAGG